MPTSLTLHDGVLVFRTPFCPDLTRALKANVPASDRQWDDASKAWRVAPIHAHLLVDLAARCLGKRLAVPALPDTAPAAEARLLDVRYIGRCKDRGGGDRTAFGWSGGGWSVIFPEPVLRDWFGDEARPDEHQTLYAVLGVRQSAAAADLKTAYRRLAKQWHPDVCHEPDAAALFKLINHAYQVLNDPRLRAKYDAGLALEAAARQTAASRSRGSNREPSLNPLREAPRWGIPATGYRPPLRCGRLLVSGLQRLQRFVVERIDAWEDIVGPDGRTLVTSWPPGADRFVERWM